MRSWVQSPALKEEKRGRNRHSCWCGSGCTDRQCWAPAHWPPRHLALAGPGQGSVLSQSHPACGSQSPTATGTWGILSLWVLSSSPLRPTLLDASSTTGGLHFPWVAETGVQGHPVLSQCSVGNQGGGEKFTEMGNANSQCTTVTKNRQAEAKETESGVRSPLTGHRCGGAHL